MGAKTALLAFSDGDLPPALLGATRSTPAEAEELVRAVLPGYSVTLDGDTTLDETYPPDDIACAAVLPGAELICDRRLVLDRPSELPQHLLEAGAGRRIIMHGMHSVNDWLCFAVWQDKQLIRSLSLSPDSGVVENIGEPLDFERPYWAGEHSLDDDSYSLPFHPLDLGEEALRALFGFIIEGRFDPDDVVVDDVHLHRFRVEDPTGAQQADRAAAYRHARQTMRRRTLEMGPDGVLREVTTDR